MTVAEQNILFMVMVGFKIGLFSTNFFIMLFTKTDIVFKHVQKIIFFNIIFLCVDTPFIFYDKSMMEIDSLTTFMVSTSIIFICIRSIEYAKDRP